MTYLTEVLIPLWQQIRGMREFWGFVSIPVVAAVVTWAHVWVAIQMTFYPIEFIGIKAPWLGWQGIIPRKAKKMAEIVVDRIISKIGTVEELFHEMEPTKIATHMSSALVERAEEFTDEIMLECSAVLWENLPQGFKKRVYIRVRRHIPLVIDNLVQDLNEHIDELMDIKEMIVNRLVADKALMVRVFKEVGNNEFKFIVNSSFWIGLFFGCVQMILWYAVRNWQHKDIMLPLYGAVLGYLTNWVALNMVFRPLHPIKLGPFTLQGVFLKRQNEVAEQYAHLVTLEMISVKHIMWQIFNGNRSNRTRHLIKKHLNPLLETSVVRTALQITVGAEAYMELKQSIAAKAVHMSMEPLSDPAFNKERAITIEKIFAERMKTLTPDEFQDLLRPAFQEDEWILITLGAVMGFIAGWVQLVVGFH
jgi:uncharacterized membrane protein YheB (UPF0754 family)